MLNEVVSICKLLLVILQPAPGRYSSEYLVGVCRPFSPNPDPISGQKMSFSKVVFRPRLLAEIISSFFRLERKQKISSNAFRIRIFLLHSYSFGTETINTFIHSRSSLEIHTRFRIKMGEVYSMWSMIRIVLLCDVIFRNKTGAPNGKF